MKTSITLIGAGGKMGCRLTDNLKDSVYQMSYVEISPVGLKKLESMGLVATPQEQAVPETDVVILAVPDTAIKSVAASVVPQMKSDALLILLDPAAAYVGHLPARSDINYFISHPCHPSIFNVETTEEARRDFFGGVLAKQAIVCTLVQGKPEAYQLGEEIAKTMFAPVTRSHRLTLEQMAILEPTMAETIGATVAVILKEAMDEAVNQGVPLEAARDFMLGHINIELAIAFGEADNPFSDAAYVAIEYGKKHLIKENWKQLFNKESIMEQINQMLHLDKNNRM